MNIDEWIINLVKLINMIFNQLRMNDWISDWKGLMTRTMIAKGSTIGSMIGERSTARLTIG